MPAISLTVNRDHLRAAVHTCAVGDIRFYLNGVLIEAYPQSVFVVSTDGHRMSIFKSETANPSVPAEGVKFIIPLALVKSVKSFKTLSDITVIFDPETLAVTIQDVDGAQSAKAIDGLFPDWRRVVPATVSGEAAQFNPDYVSDLAKIAKSLGAKPQLVHIFHGGLASSAVTIGGRPEFLGVLMPLRTKPEQQPMPSTGWNAPGIPSETDDLA